MDHAKHYHSLINKSKVRGVVKSDIDGYFEAHHIVPRCMGGEDTKENLVLLTAKEHYIAHLLLYKMYPTDKKLFYAVNMMSGQGKFKNYSINSRLYQKISENNAHMISKENAPSFKDFTGQRFGRLTVVGLAGWRQRERDGCYESRWLCECDCGNYKEVAGKNIQQGSTKSCGCLAKDSYPKFSKTKGITGRGPYKSGATTWDTSGDSRPWKSHHIMKYQHNLDKWLLSDYYYSLWNNFCKGESDYLFWKFYKESHNDFETPKNYFSLMVGMFLGGWIPSQDSEWQVFLTTQQ